MANIIKRVKVSPHYPKNGWYDPKAKMNFFKKDGIIEIKEGTSMVNINRHIRFNYLIEIPSEKQMEEEKELKPNQNQKGLSPNKLLNAGNDAVKDVSSDNNADDSPKEASSKKSESKELEEKEVLEDETLEEEAEKEVEEDDEEIEELMKTVEKDYTEEGLKEKSYGDLQSMAKQLDIKANGSTEDLRERVLKAIQDR